MKKHVHALRIRVRVSTKDTGNFDVRIDLEQCAVGQGFVTEITLCYQDEDTNIGYVRWTGSAWAGQGELLSTTGKTKTDPGFSCVFENGGTRDNYIMTAYTDTAQTNYSFWNNTSYSKSEMIGSF